MDSKSASTDARISHTPIRFPLRRYVSPATARGQGCRFADTPTRRHADTPIRPYADTFWVSGYSTSCFSGFVPSALAQMMLRMTSGSPMPKDQRMPKCSAT